MARAKLAGCPDCGTVARKIPEENGKYAFDGCKDVAICVTDDGVYAHYVGVGE